MLTGLDLGSILAIFSSEDIKMRTPKSCHFKQNMI